MKKLNEIQQKLKAPKNQKNTFGNYNYRSCEDILEAVKPLLGEATLVLVDEIVHFPVAHAEIIDVKDKDGTHKELLGGDRFYIKATATLKEGDKMVSSTAYAREALTKKGMDTSQITGATSSYARKYALNGLFLIDDTKDADTMDNSVDYGKKEEAKKISVFEQAMKVIKAEKDKNKLEEWKKKFETSTKYTEDERFELIALISKKI